MELLIVWHVLSKRRFWVIVPFMAALAAATAIGLRVQPSYQATAKVLLEHKEKPASVLGPGLPGSATLNTLSKTGTPLDTQVEVAQRAAILTQVVRRADLRDAQTGAPLTISRFLKEGRVSILKGTDILAFSYRHPDPRSAQRVADDWARAYVEDNQSLGRQELQSQATFLTNQLQGSRQELNQAELALRDFKKAHAAIAPAEEAKASAHTLSMLEAELRQTSASNAEAAARLRVLRRQVGLSASQALDSAAISQNPGVQRLREQLLAAETELALSKGRLTEDNPDVRMRRAHVEVVRSRLAAEASRSTGRQGDRGIAAEMDPVRQALTRDLMQAEVATIASQSRKEALQRIVGTFEARLSALPDKEHRLVQLERSAVLAAERLNLLQRSLEETKLKLAMNLGSTRLIEQAELPEEPVGSVGLAFVLAGALVGLGAGLGLALLREYLDGSIKSVAEAEAIVGLPFLEELPWHPAGAGIAMLCDPGSSASEAIRLVRTRLFGPDGRLSAQVLALTSAGPREGTSTAVANLGVSFAQLGCRVLLIDADLRNPTLHRLAAVPNEQGLTDVLTGRADLAHAVRPGPVDHLSVLTSGACSDTGADLLASPAMSALLSELRAEYDLVLLDLPPVLAAPNACILAGRLDGFLFVMGLDLVTPNAARRAIDRLVASGGRVLGTLLCRLHRNGQSHEAQRPHRALQAARAGGGHPLLGLPAPGQP
jgi:capsular exopolysaccharide synthesis family protein